MAEGKIGENPHLDEIPSMGPFKRELLSITNLL